MFRVTGGMDKEKIVFHLAARDRALRDLSLAFCSRIDNQRLSHVARIPTLLSLSLRGCTSVGDAGLAWVAALPRLRVLNLRGCTGVRCAAAAVSPCRSSATSGMTQVSHSISRLEAPALLHLYSILYGPSGPDMVVMINCSFSCPAALSA